MISKKLVTVFIPMYNAEKYIKYSLESILNQTYKNIEILIIDDGSTDNSVSIVKQYNDKRIRLIKNGVNKGLPYTRNRALKEAKGKFFALMDADDISMKNRIEKEVDFLEQNKDIDVVSSQIQYFPQSKIKIFIKKLRFIFLNDIDAEHVKVKLLFGNPVANPSSMVRMESIKRMSIKYNDKFFVAQDYEFWSNISKYGKIYIMKSILLKYRSGHMNITKTSSINRKEERMNMISNIKNNLLDFYKFDLNNEEKILFNKFFGEERLCKIQEEEINLLHNLSKKIILNNDYNNLLNQKILEMELNNHIFNVIKFSYLKLENKIKIYKKLVVRKSKTKYYRDIIEILLRNYIK